MLKKVLEKQIVWIPIVIAIVVIIAVIIGIVASKNKNDNQGKSNPDIVTDADEEHTSDIDEEKPNEEGLIEVKGEDVQKEDAVKTPSSWDESESDNSSTTTNNNQNANGNDIDNQESEIDHEEDDNMSSDETPTDDRQYGTIF